MKLISTPTKKDWIAVLKKAIKGGYGWYIGCKDIDEFRWDVYKKESVIQLRGIGRILFCDKNFLSVKYPNTPIITTQQYLQGEEVKQK